MKWVACELHTHTVHSDGQFGVNELIQRSRELGIETIAITDHNTDSAHDEISRSKLSGSFPIIRGLEWTTCYGHVLIIGGHKYVDWREVTPYNIDENLIAVREGDGVVGVAHPYAAGDPVCCGCNWEFLLKDWSLADYIEIWSGSMPQLSQRNVRAGVKWNRLLDQGIYLTGVSSRDWHGDEDDSKPFGVTYLLLDETIDVTEAAKDALRKHRAYATVGPEISVAAYSDKAEAGIGGTLPGGYINFRMQTDYGRRASVWEAFDIKPEYYSLIGPRDEELARAAFTGYGIETCLCAELSSGWIRVELHGTMNGYRCPIVITNPVIIR